MFSSSGLSRQKIRFVINNENFALFSDCGLIGFKLFIFPLPIINIIVIIIIIIINNEDEASKPS